MKKFLLLLVSASFLAFLTGCATYNEAYKMTSPGVFEEKQLPKSTLLVTETQGEYFDKSNPLFRNLFNYIKKNEVPMTVPVESEFSDKAAMRFYVADDQLKKNLADQGEVKVVNMEERTVVSYGSTGSYSKENIDEAKDKLQNWLKDHPEFKATGKPYAVFWNSPFNLWFMKHYEIHIPVEGKKK